MNRRSNVVRVSSPEKDAFQRLQWWRIGQIGVWCIGFGIFLALLIRPDWGLHSFWDILIPLAPAMIVIVPGVWRNVCPISAISLISRHLGWSQKKRLSRMSQAKLTTAGLILLLVLIPLRHILLNVSGIATAALLLILVTIAFIFGLLYDWKSAWCAGMCPVHQVEKLYGARGVMPFLNAHCSQCHNCSIPCPDSTPASYEIKRRLFADGNRNTWILCGGFPGYIWGWFQVLDYYGPFTLDQFVYAYTWPLFGFVVSFMIFWIVFKVLSSRSSKLLFNGFTALAVSTYYWYRIPALLGFGIYPGDGMLLDLTGSMPSYVPTLIAAVIGLFFFWWFLGRSDSKLTWLIRPEYARK